MKKTILTPEECGYLIPHWHELDENKSSRLRRMFTRKSTFQGHKDTSVLTAPPIVLYDGSNDTFFKNLKKMEQYHGSEDMLYILNGKHRAFYAFLNGFNVEACVVQNRNELMHHIPKKCLGGKGIDALLDAFDRKVDYVSLCHSNGIYSIMDFN